MDTMALILRIEGRQLSPAAKEIMERAESGTAILYVPAMVLAEILYLAEKRRIGLTFEDVGLYIKRFSGYVEYPLQREVITAAGQIDDIPELHDRLIAERPFTST